jgi:hypothetical protein
MQHTLSCAPSSGPSWPEAIEQAADTDAALDQLHARIIALEEALTSRRARRRLRRSIASSAETFTWAGPSFHDRRVEAAANDLLRPV